MCLEVGNGLSGWFQFRVARVFGLRMLAGATVSEDLTGAGGSLPRWLTHVAVGRKHQFFTICATPLCCLNVPIWQLAPPERVLRQRERQGEKEEGREGAKGWERGREVERHRDSFRNHIPPCLPHFNSYKWVFKSDPFAMGIELGSTFEGRSVKDFLGKNLKLPQFVGKCL